MQAAGDLRLALEGAFAIPAGDAAADSARHDQSTWRRALPAVAATVITSSVVGVTTWSLTRSDRPSPGPVRFAIHAAAAEGLNIAADSTDVAISPDGRQVAYLTGDGNLPGEPKQLMLRSLHDFTPATLAGGAPLYHPFFSSDGEWVGFYNRRNGELQRVSVHGGPVQRICVMDGSRAGRGHRGAVLRGASWGEDDTIVFATNAFATGLWRVPASGGTPEPMSTPEGVPGEGDHRWPEILPGGDAALFTVLANPVDESQIAVLSLATGAWKVVVNGGFHARYTSTGHLVYGFGSSMWAVRFELDRLEADGAPVEIVSDVMTKSQGGADFDLSENGSLVYVPPSGQEEHRTLVWVDREGNEEAVAASPRAYESPRISPDGRRVALHVQDMDPENVDLIVYDLERDTPSRVTTDPGHSPVWSPDGGRVLFQSGNIYSKAADATGPTARLTTSGHLQWPYTWSADGQTLVVGTAPGREVVNRDIEVIFTISPRADNRVEPLLRTEFVEMHPDVSPNGRWIAYSSNESGRSEVYVRPFPNVDDGRWPVSRDGGWSPVWAPGGRELFFRSAEVGDMMVVEVETDPTFSAGIPRRLFSAASYLRDGFSRTRPWDVADDGRFLMIKEGAAAGEQGGEPRPDIVYVQDWHQELLERVPIP